MLHTIFDGKTNIEFKPMGDSSISVQFGTEIHPAIHRKVKAFVDHLEKESFTGYIECVPAFTSVTVFYHTLRVYQNYDKDKIPVEKNMSPYKIVCAILNEIIKNLEESQESMQRVVEIPVCYGGEFGPDLEAVADYHHLSTSDVVDIHSKEEYLVYMLGFAPGFPYLGGMSEKIATPRRHSPRLSIPVGSVGIAGMQTGVYPISTPGGWQLIGRTPLELFCPNEHPPTLLQSGDIVKFVPISLEEYQAYKEKTL
ncbi:kinase inhibitor [Bacillus sp. SA1-12]|uniref:5-oxoprolinase subunit PxpB n=1 Tax=Bacillus sp. SA1-12 TaxID=1455638 RepID=UPI000626F8BC|nr:5-oxoprolinase subunit PxpB [Bacillus sp. SA1-12]KKI88931.1 kinase inhibitor [Bacillus sp. SA1-12]